MDMLPLILLVGQSSSGKDTVAGMLVKQYKAVAIAQADPLKRYCKYVLGFTDEQLWGPSDNRNVPVVLDSPSDVRKRNRDYNSDYILRDILGKTELKINILKYLDEWVDEVIKLSQKGGVTPRFALQTLGDVGRFANKDLWVDYAKRVA